MKWIVLLCLSSSTTIFGSNLVKEATLKYTNTGESKFQESAASSSKSSFSSVNTQKKLNEVVRRQCIQADLRELAIDYQKTKKILEELYIKELNESGCEV